MNRTVLDDHPVLATRLDGTSLIEASAGTGKTWTIVGLYLRLLLERAVAPRSILVVTFTNAATAELRDRIRRELVALRDALEPASASNKPASPLIEALVARVDPADHAVALARIRLAVESLDEAAIHTIHGFCQRLLAENAFASAVPFETDVRATQTRLVNDVARDFWRQTIGTAHPFESRLLAAAGRTPDALVAAARSAMGARIGKILEPDAVDVAGLGERLAGAYRDASEAWAGERERIETMLLAGALNGRRYPAKSVKKWCDDAARFLGYDSAPLDSPDAFERFGESFMANAVNKNKTPPHHPFFAAADRLNSVLVEAKAAAEAHWWRLVARFAIEGGAAVARRKLDEGWQSYDDMLMRVHEALSSSRGDALAHAVAARYTVALIDEFQDTDEVQYAILRRLFQETGCTTVLVGDPKQAIYGFRGADVFAYLRARRSASEQLALLVNRRSSKPLLAAVNALCGRGTGRFLLPDISFNPAESPAEESATLAADDNLPPLVLWFAPGAPGEGAHKGSSRIRIASAVAEEIGRIMDSAGSKKAWIEEGGVRRMLTGRDIAVLVSRHSEADLMRDALAARNIASVTFGDRSIFQTQEAQDFAQLLAAIVNPEDERLIRGALATPMFGLTITGLAALVDHPNRWEATLARFHHYRALVEASGLVRVFREIVATTDLAGRMLGALGGDRAITNYQQLAELLHDAQRSEGLDTVGVSRYLRRLMSEDEPADDEAQLRLETDEALVRIMTIHRAKGLEFPVVFCPFLWDGQARAANTMPVRFHDAMNADTPVIDFGSPAIDTHRAYAETEMLAERIRVAYVALTRAKFRCYLVWGGMKECASSALAWLIHGPDAPGPDLAEARRALVDRLIGLSSAEFRGEVDALASATGDGMAVVELPEPLETSKIERRIVRRAGRASTFDGGVPALRRISSFSALMANAEPDIPDHDGFVAPPAVDERDPEDDIIAFPRGARAGSCLHAVFERVLIERRIESKAWLSVATRTLDEFGLPVRFAETVARIVDHVLNTTIDAPSGLSLGAVRADALQVEMEFWVPIRAERLAALDRIVALHREARALPPLAPGSIPRALAKGYLKGFIDLVFEHHGRYYVADYKSNWLGPTIDDYGEPALAASIAAECYDLQYLLYTLAVDRYLSTRIADYDYERHFGGVFYLYLRGLRSDHGARRGVYFSRPAIRVVDALRALCNAGSS
ncbi:MAG: exodeoxyribonuclease V subunit beta [Burkholderiales bacterium]